MSTLSKQILMVIALVVTTMVWGITFIMVKWTVAEMDVYYFLFLRFFIAFIFTAMIFKCPLLKVDRKTLMTSLILSVILTGSFITQTEGLRFTTATNSGMITGLYLVLIPITSALFFRTSVHINSYAGAIISFAGLYMLTQYSPTGMNYGDLLTLICAIGWTLHIILTGRFTLKHETVPLVTYQFMFTAIFLGIATLIKGDYTSNISNIGWLTIIVTAIFATALALLLQAVAQKYIDPTRVGIIFALEAVFAALFAWWLGGETLTTIAFTGACLMVAGMAMSEARPLVQFAANKIWKRP